MLATLLTRRSLALALMGCGPPSSAAQRGLAAAAATPCPLRRRRASSAAARASASTGKDAAAESSEKPVRLDKLLSNLGYGSRREVAALIRGGRVEVLPPAEGENGAPPPPTKSGGKKGKNEQRLSADSRALPSRVRLDGEPLDPRPPLTLLLHKPDGYVVASPDDPKARGPTVYDLLPERFGARKPVLGPAGRLDKATSGLMLLTDDGQLAHRVMSPKKVLWKEYEATLDAPLSDAELADAARLFASGEMVLAGDDGSPSAGRPLLPAKLSSSVGMGPASSSSVVRVRVCEGRYHQVRRMMAAVGREVVALRRLSVGGLGLFVDGEEAGEGEGGAGAAGAGEGMAAIVRLAPGEWRAATEADLAALFSGGVAAEEEEEDEGEAAGASPAPAPALRGDGDQDEAEMHRRARVDSRRREKRRAAREDVVAR
jgi:16S rRNA pseudouridine516 synthase